MEKYQRDSDMVADALKQVRRVGREAARPTGTEINQTTAAVSEIGVRVDEAMATAERALAEVINAGVTSDGRNRIYLSESEPEAPENGFSQGDQWAVQAGDRVSELRVWNGTGWVPLRMLADELIVVGDDGVVQLKDGVVTAEKLSADAIDGKRVRGVTVEGGRFVGGQFELLSHAPDGQPTPVSWNPTDWEAVSLRGMASIVAGSDNTLKITSAVSNIPTTRHLFSFGPNYYDYSAFDLTAEYELEYDFEVATPVDRCVMHIDSVGESGAEYRAIPPVDDSSTRFSGSLPLKAGLALSFIAVIVERTFTPQTSVEVTLHTWRFHKIGNRSGAVISRDAHGTARVRTFGYGDQAELTQGGLQFSRYNPENPTELPTPVVVINNNGVHSLERFNVEAPEVSVPALTATPEEVTEGTNNTKYITPQTNRVIDSGIVQYSVPTLPQVSGILYGSSHTVTIPALAEDGKSVVTISSLSNGTGYGFALQSGQTPDPENNQTNVRFRYVQFASSRAQTFNLLWQLVRID